MKVKLNPFILVGALVCLVSMLFSYLTLRVPLLRFGIPWYYCSVYLNHILYAIPVTAILMLLSGLVDSKPFQLFAVITSVILIVWYLATYKNPLNGEAVDYILGANVLLSGYMGIEDFAGNVETTARIIGQFSHLGIGFLLYILGTIINGFGAVVGESFGGFSGGSSNREDNSSSGNRSFNQY